MPKEAHDAAAKTSDEMLSGLFAVRKPSGRITMDLLNALKPLMTASPLFYRAAVTDDAARYTKKRRRGPYSKQDKIKLGQAGTLDPLASGVLVIGINKGTKRLSDLLNGVKEYKTTGLFGASTDTYDSEGKIVHRKRHRGLTREKVESILDRFRGEIQQKPPIFSALKMDGKALYEYARTDTPLPRPIEARKCTVYDLQLTDWQEPAQHHWRFPSSEIEPDEKAGVAKIEQQQALFEEPASVEAQPVNAMRQADSDEGVDPNTDEDEGVGPSFSLSMRVSSGTYVRSIVNDIAIALGTAAHVVELVRTRQGDFVLDPTPEQLDAGLRPCVDWQILQDAIDAFSKGATATNGKADWETAIVERFMKV